MRVVADTNTVVSGLLWHGAPRQVLDAAADGKLQLFTTGQLLAELEDVLQREKFAQRLLLAKADSHELTVGYAALATVVKPAEIDPIVAADPDDDDVLACAITAIAEAVVSGDSHLLELKTYQQIPIVTASEMLARMVTGQES